MGLAQPRLLLPHVRDDAARSIGGGRGPQVGDEIEQRGVLLVADRADHRGEAAGHGADHRLVRERQQVFDRTAASGDDDDVDRRVTVEAGDRVDDLADRVHSLDSDVLNPKTHGWPTDSSILEDVMLGGRGAAADQSDGPREERQRPFATHLEQAFCRENGLEPFESGQQVTEADRADLDRRQRQRAASEVEVRLCVDDDPRALGQRRHDRSQDGTGAGDVQRDVCYGVAQHDERRPRAGPGCELGHLPLDPDPA